MLRQIVRRMARDRQQQMPQPFQDQVRTSVGRRNVLRDESARASAKGQRAEPLRPAQVNLGRAIDTVQHGRQFPIGPQQAVPGDQFPRT